MYPTIIVRQRLEEVQAKLDAIKQEMLRAHKRSVLKNRIFTGIGIFLLAGLIFARLAMP